MCTCQWTRILFIILNVSFWLQASLALICSCYNQHMTLCSLTYCLNLMEKTENFIFLVTLFSWSFPWRISINITVKPISTGLIPISDNLSKTDKCRILAIASTPYCENKSTDFVFPCQFKNHQYICVISLNIVIWTRSLYHLKKQISSELFWLENSFGLHFAVSMYTFLCMLWELPLYLWAFYLSKK